MSIIRLNISTIHYMMLTPRPYRKINKNLIYSIYTPTMYTSIPTNIPDPFQIQYPGLGAAQVPVAQSGHMSSGQTLSPPSSPSTNLTASQLLRPIVLSNTTGGNFILPTVTDLVDTWGVSNTANPDNYVVPVYRMSTDSASTEFISGTGGSGAVVIPAYSAGVPACLIFTFFYNSTTLVWTYLVQ
jgi:hypothetical protein